MAQKAAARACKWSGARLSYLENAQQNVVETDLDRLLPLYGVPEAERARFYTAVEQSQTRGWWERYEPVVPDFVAIYVGLEQGASAIRTYEPVAVPGVLQTTEYAATLMRGGLRRRSAREVQRLVELRLGRQRILTREADPVQFAAVIDESVLRRTPRDHKVMVGQLQHLVELAERPNITLRVLPLDAGMQSFAPGPFSILSFPWEQTDPGVVFIEYRDGGVYLEDFEEVERHALAFGELADMAMTPDDSIATIQRTERQIRQ
jgi:hypothetical protein